MDNQHPVESKDVQRTIILNIDGVPTNIGGTDERAVVNEDGGHTFIKTSIRIATIDGHIIDVAKGDVALTCPVCHQGPYSRHVMSPCMACRRLSCATCSCPTPNGNFCATCQQAIKRQAFWQWLLDII